MTTAAEDVRSDDDDGLEVDDGFSRRQSASIFGESAVTSRRYHGSTVPMNSIGVSPLPLLNRRAITDAAETYEDDGKEEEATAADKCDRDDDDGGCGGGVDFFGHETETRLSEDSPNALKLRDRLKLFIFDVNVARVSDI